MRAFSVGILAVSLGANQLAGQAPPAPRPLPQVACPPQGCNVGNSHVVHISSSADVRLENGVLHYVTSQVLQNNGGENAEVIWTLPLPPQSAFHNLTMSIYGEMIMGEIYSKQRARAIYNAIVATKKDPALVEWEGRDQLRTSIYPIMPAETKYIDMRLQAVPKQTGNVIRVDYFAGSNYAGHLAPDVAAVSMTFSYPDSAHYGVPYSSTHIVSAETVGRGMRTVTVTGKRTDATLFLPVIKGGAGSISVLPHAVAGEEGYALINIVAPTIAHREVPRDVLIALDVSTSMAGFNSLQAMEGAHAALSALRPNDRFRVVAFANSVSSHDSHLVPATTYNVTRARQFVSKVRLGGGTNTVAALEEAFGSFDSLNPEGRSQRVFLLTDGAPSKGEVRYDSIVSRVAAKRGRATLSVFQVGFRNQPFDLLKDVAAAGGGTVHIAEATGSVVEQVTSVMRKQESPVLSNVRLHSSTVELKGIDATALENMRAGESRSFAVRYRGAGSAAVTVSAVANGRQLSWSERVQFPAEERLNGFAARLWATDRVGASAINLARGCGPVEADSVISELGTRFSIPTPMTSYMVLEPGIRIGPNGEVLNAQDFATKPVASAALAAARSGEKALALSSVVTTGLADPAAGRRAPFSATHIDGERLEVAALGSPLEMLAGKVAGLQVRGGTLPGSDVVIQIRNPLSLSGSTEPLIIVDGVIQMQDDPAFDQRAANRNLLDVVSENIESIEVLHGASAAAMYGQRAANGVIIITTRRGTHLSLTKPSSAKYVSDSPPASALYRTSTGASSNSVASQCPHVPR